ncbi:reverse transcriptase domain-containing protein [Tanacetum coccineum]|uniref:Reverse transcriptase domain-containing protein n=1 Tax=Tanacetum coccineum TaxID=301880 RepID=A0ABQ5JH27_9ASTR
MLSDNCYIHGWKEVDQTGRGCGRTAIKVTEGVSRGNKMIEPSNEVTEFSTVIAQQLQDMLPTIVAQVGDHISNQGINGSRNDNAANDNIHEDVRNVNLSNCRMGVHTRSLWHVSRRTLMKVKYFAGLLIDFKALMKESVTDRFPLRLATSPHLSPKDQKDRTVRNGSLKNSVWKRGYDGEPSKEGNVKGDNKRARTRKHFAKDCRTGPKMVNPLNARNPTAARGECYECGGTDHYKSACLRLNRAPGQGGNRPNQALAIEGGLGRGNNGNLARGRAFHQDKKENRPNQALAIEGGQSRGNNGNPARGRAFVMGAEEARQDPNIVTGTFSLNNHYATMLFDSDADYSFVSTTFMPLLDIKPSSLGFSYEIEIASEELVEINKVIRGCKLEIEGHTFDIDLIPFGHESFDVITGIDWLSRHRAEIVCHERVV